MTGYGGQSYGQAPYGGSSAATLVISPTGENCAATRELPVTRNLTRIRHQTAIRNLPAVACS